MKTKLAYCLFALLLVGATWVPIADAQPAVQKGRSEIIFQNATDATIRIDAISGPGEDSLPPKTVKPNSTLSFTVKSGVRKFDLAAYLANPIRIYTIALQLKENETLDFKVIPHIFGVFVLEDANARAALAAASSR